MAREYALSAGGITVQNSAVTLAFINPGAGQSIEILRSWISQSANATSAQQRVQHVTQAATFPVLTSTTPAKLKLSDPASVITGGTSGAAGTSGTNSSDDKGGAKTVLINDAFNVLNGHLWIPTPYETYILNAGASQGFGVYLPVAPATLTNWTVGLTFREL